MVSLLIAIRNLFRSILDLFFPRKIEIVRRFPSAKVIRANYLGLTIGLMCFLVVGWTHLDAICASLPWYEVAFHLALFFAGTYLLGGFFIPLLGLLGLLVFLLAPETFKTLTRPETFEGYLILFAMWYLIGYAFGALFATFYNDLVYLYLTIFKKNVTKIAFAYYPYHSNRFSIMKSPPNKFNIIKSPRDKEEKAFGELMKNDSSLKERRLYHFELNTSPPKPYTILFVANPYVRPRGVGETSYHEFKRDPIVRNQDLFFQAVNRALHAFEHDEVLGNREIWSRVRIATIFDPSLDRQSALVEEFQGFADIDGDAPDNLLDPMQQMNDRVKKMLGKNLAFDEVDVIFALSAHPSHDRAMSHWSDFDESAGVVTNGAAGATFPYNPNPSLTQTKNAKPPAEDNDIRVIERFRRNGSIVGANFEHEHFVKSPGRVALNVLGANSRTFMHEFAHAMSSVKNGAIMDEYADIMILKPSKLDPDPRHPFYVNRIERRRRQNGKFVPIHKVFADYNGVEFHSDLSHPSAEENWLNYFPERSDPHVGCTMDRYQSRYRFDKLISNFMYDRITAKLNRS